MHLDIWLRNIFFSCFEFLSSLKNKVRSYLISLLKLSSLNLIGPFPTYSDALANSNGYDDPVVLQKVFNATHLLLTGQFRYERDGTAFSSYPSPLYIRNVISRIIGEFSTVLDFGGGLGGNYISNSDIFSNSNKYIVCEQPNFVVTGKEIAKNYCIPIEFVSELPSEHIDIVICSSVLQYLESPYDLLSSIELLKPEYIILDRTAFAENPSWYVQLNETYYTKPVSYPFCSISLSSVLKILFRYEIVFNWINQFDSRKPHHHGYLFKRIYN